MSLSWSASWRSCRGRPTAWVWSCGGSSLRRRRGCRKKLRSSASWRRSSRASRQADTAAFCVWHTHWLPGIDVLLLWLLLHLHCSAPSEQRLSHLLPCLCFLFITQLTCSFATRPPCRPPAALGRMSPRRRQGPSARRQSLWGRMQQRRWQRWMSRWVLVCNSFMCICVELQLLPGTCPPVTRPPTRCCRVVSCRAGQGRGRQPGEPQGG